MIAAAGRGGTIMIKSLKELIKRHIIAFLLIWFVIGTVVIWAVGDVSDVHVTGDGKISGTVLWLTALAIFWYAYETYQLKISTSEQVVMQEVIMQNEFLPILEPIGKGTGARLQAGRFTNLEIRNLGKGPAKYIELHLGRATLPLNWSLASGEHKTVRLTAAERRIIAEAMQDSARIRLRLTYQDIYKRVFQTEHIVFDKAPRGAGYRLRSGAWDFKRVRRP